MLEEDNEENIQHIEELFVTLFGLVNQMLAGVPWGIQNIRDNMNWLWYFIILNREPAALLQSAYRLIIRHIIYRHQDVHRPHLEDDTLRPQYLLQQDSELPRLGYRRHERFPRGLVMNFFDNDLDVPEVQHELLYIAAKIAFTCRLTDSRTVADLLTEIYSCDFHFMGLFPGAFTNDFSYRLFVSKAETIEAFEFFLYNATKEQKVFLCSNGDYERMTDVQYDESNNMPTYLAIMDNNVRMFKLLVRYGAKCLADPNNDVESAMEALYAIRRYNPVRWTMALEECRKILYRAHPYLNARNEFPKLKSLARKTIRDDLYTNFELPQRINQLPIPHNVKKYLDLHS